MIEPIQMTLPDVPPDPPAPTYTMPPLAFQRGRKFTDADFKPIVEGEIFPPNLKPLDHAAFLNLLFWHSGAQSGYIRLERDRPGLAPYARPVAKFFFASSQWGDPTGKGIIMVRSRSAGVDLGIECYSFALCEHEFSPDPGNNPRRGHNFGHCSKCGFDLSVDSSD